MRRMRGSGKKTSLNAVEQYELNQWLEQNEITSTNLRRSFTDVLPLARLLARYYPDLIDLNYYPPRNSVHNKLCNWESFNKRVLTRLGLHLSRDQMVRVARSVPGSVDLLLFNIMRLQLAAERKALEAKGSSSSDNETTALQQQVQQQPSDSQQLLEEVGTEKPATDNTIYDTDNGQSDVNEQPQRPRTLKQAQAALRRSERAQRATGTATLQRRSHNATTGGSSEQPHQRGEHQHEQHHQQHPQRTVLYSHYMQAVKQLQQRNAKIARFHQLSAHLESMLQLKSERIDELQQQVARLNPSSHLHPPPPPADSAQQTAEVNNKNKTKHNKFHTQKRRLRRPKKRASGNTIQALTAKVPMPDFGFAASPFPLKLTPNTHLHSQTFTNIH